MGRLIVVLPMDNVQPCAVFQTAEEGSCGSSGEAARSMSGWTWQLSKRDRKPDALQNCPATPSQSGCCDTENTHIADGMREDVFKNGRSLLFDEVDADIGIQHHLHAKEGFRFWTGGCCLPPSMKSSVNKARLSRSSCHGCFFGQVTCILSFL